VRARALGANIGPRFALEYLSIIRRGPRISYNLFVRGTLSSLLVPSKRGALLVKQRLAILTTQSRHRTFDSIVTTLEFFFLRAGKRLDHSPRIEK
jgi:hypothetical protein